MPSTITAEKAALRKLVREIPFTAEEKRRSDRRLFRRFLTLPQLPEAASILLYFGVGSEPETARLIEPLSRLGLSLSLPRCLPEGRMEARLYRGKEHLIPGSFGIPEPALDCPVVKRGDLSMILVPGLCFDRRRFRLGHGGGYYDRYLDGYPGLTVALCRDRLLLPALPVEPHDRAVDLLLTESCCLSLS